LPGSLGSTPAYVQDSQLCQTDPDAADTTYTESPLSSARPAAITAARHLQIESSIISVINGVTTNKSLHQVQRQRQQRGNTTAEDNAYVDNFHNVITANATSEVIQIYKRNA